MRPTHRSIPTPGIVAGAVVLSAALATPSEAQDVRFRTVSNQEYAGFMGSVMSMSGERMGPDTTTTWIRNALRREDQADGKASWVIDMSTMDMLRIDHEEQVYWTLNFPAFMQSADSSMAAAREEMSPEEQAQMQQMASFEPSIEVDRTGETQVINGWEAERVIMTLTIRPAENSEAMEDPGADPMAAMMGRTAMVLLSDLWISDEMPGYREMREALGDEAADFAAASGGMASMAAANPQMASLTEEMQEQMEGLQGDAVRSTSYMMMVPEGVELQRDSILALADQPLPRGPDMSELLAAAMAAEGRDAAADAVGRALGGRLGGLFGRDREEEEEPEVAEAGFGSTPTIMMRITTEIIDVERPTLSDADFQPPAGYTEVQRGG